MSNELRVGPQIARDAAGGGILHVAIGGARSDVPIPIRLTALAVTIGRASGGIRFPHDGAVSRAHAVIERDGTSYVVRDLGSTNGTFVNGRRISSAVLFTGDIIRVGNSLLVFHTDAIH